jgi:glutamate--cysteine ligase
MPRRLRLGGSAQCRIQAGAGGCQSVSRGFNLNPDFHTLCVQAAMSAIEKACPDARAIALIPENHTRNQFYLQNVEKLSRILRHAGVEVRIGSLLPEITAATDIELTNGTTLRLEPLKRDGNRVKVGDMDPCVVLLNNDLSAGVPAILQGLEQNVLPPLHAGWATRRKSSTSPPTTMSPRLRATDRHRPWLINLL